MIRTATILMATSIAASAEPVDVPSGQPMTFVEVVQNAPGVLGLTYRFRFLAPWIARDGGTVSNETAAADMDFLCAEFALPKLPATGPVPNQIIISLSDRSVEFGLPDPDATQFFEAYNVVDNSCIWEGF